RLQRPHRGEGPGELSAGVRARLRDLLLDPARAPLPPRAPDAAGGRPPLARPLLRPAAALRSDLAGRLRETPDLRRLALAQHRSDGELQGGPRDLHPAPREPHGAPPGQVTPLRRES